MIKIIDGWFYEYDGTQYILFREEEREVYNKVKKEKRFGVVKTTIGYFPKIEAMLLKMTELMAKAKIDSGEITTLEQHIQELRNIKNQLSDIVMPF